jgi:hypothetical protein
MNNPSPLDLATTGSKSGITVNLTGSLPFLTLVGDVKAKVNGIGTYNGAAVMGSELDNYKSILDFNASTTVSAAAVDELDEMRSANARTEGFFTMATKKSIIDSESAFNAPETEPTLIDY